MTDENQGSVPDENVTLILSTDDDISPTTMRHDAKPIKVQVQNALEQCWQKCDAHVEDHPEDWEKTRLYIFVAGHGIAPTPNEAALLMANASHKHYGENFSCDKFLSFFLEAQIFKEVIIFADCCREKISDAPIQEPTWTRVKKNKGRVERVTGYATYFGELALEPEAEERELLLNEEDADPNQFRGYFTKALLEGLKGKAADSKTGMINVDQLSNYVTLRVQQLTSDKSIKQKPYFPKPNANILLGHVSPTQGSQAEGQKVTIKFPLGFEGTVILFDGDDNMIDSYEYMDKLWHKQLSNGLYQVDTVEDNHNPFNNGGFFRVLSGEDNNVQL